jgi:hypothetical protein
MNMNRVMLEDCILNSKVFRESILDMLLAEETSCYSEVLSMFYKTNGVLNKIKFIGEIGALSVNRINEFAIAFPDIVNIEEYETIYTNCLLLRDAKRIAEAVIATFSK